MSALLRADLAWWECLRFKGDNSDGRIPADWGVGGRGGKGDFNSGSGSDAVLSRASTALKSIFFNARCFGASFTGEMIVEPEEEVGRDDGRFDCRCALDALSSGDPLGSGALVTRPVSLAVRRGLFVGGVETVFALAIFGWFVVSVMGVLSTGCGLRDCAIAIGPRELARPGTPTLASTKLASMVTGNAFSVIFSCREVSPRPSTRACTLLYTLRQVLKASDCGFDARSWT